jgi:hypothetical protein
MTLWCGESPECETCVRLYDALNGLKVEGFVKKCEDKVEQYAENFDIISYSMTYHGNVLSWHAFVIAILYTNTELFNYTNKLMREGKNVILSEVWMKLYMEWLPQVDRRLSSFPITHSGGMHLWRGMKSRRCVHNWECVYVNK